MLSHRPCLNVKTRILFYMYSLHPQLSSLILTLLSMALPFPARNVSVILDFSCSFTSHTQLAVKFCKCQFKMPLESFHHFSPSLLFLLWKFVQLPPCSFLTPGLFFFIPFSKTLTVTSQRTNNKHNCSCQILLKNI